MSRTPARRWRTQGNNYPLPTGGEALCCANIAPAAACQLVEASTDPDNGWQTKVVPDSRALIKLGLGPNYSAELLNAPPKTASAGAPSTTASRGIEGTAAKQ